MAEIPVYVFIGQSNAAKDEMDGFLLSALEQRGTDFEFVKLVVGSTPYAADDNALDWSTSTGELYDDLVALIQDRVAHIEAAGHTAKLTTLFSVHGESDAFNRSFSEAFEANIRDFTSSLSADLGAPDLEFVFSTVHPDYPRGGTQNTRDALFTIAGDTDTFHAVDTAGLVLYDGVHYDLASRQHLAADLVAASTATTHTTGDYASLSARPLTVGTSGIDTIETDFYGDIIYGFGGDDRIFAGGGANRVIAGSGDDKVITGTNNDFIKGGSGNDELRSGTLEALDPGNHAAPLDADVIYGQAGNDFIEDFAGNDFLDGGSDNDIIYDHAGSDTIMGRRGNDKLFDELFADATTLVFANDRIDGGSGDDYIRAHFGQDHISGGSGRDTIIAGRLGTSVDNAADDDRIDGGSDADDITVLSGNNIIFGDEGHDTITVASAGVNTVFGNDGNDTFYLGNGANTAYGGDGLDMFFDGASDNTMWGNNGDDWFRDAGGDDFYQLGRGDDRIQFGAGTDTVYGQSGSDTFVFEARSTGDKSLMDFEAVDRLFLAQNLQSYFSGVQFDGTDPNGLSTYTLDFTYGLTITVMTEDSLSDADLFWV